MITDITGRYKFCEIDYQAESKKASILMTFAPYPSFSADTLKLTVEQVQEIALGKVAGEVENGGAKY